MSENSKIRNKISITFPQYAVALETDEPLDKAVETVFKLMEKMK